MDANTDDDSCEAVVEGCTDSTAFNYNADANTDDASCEAVVEGCTNIAATNYDTTANTDIPQGSNRFEFGKLGLDSESGGVDLGCSCCISVSTK